MYGKYVIFLGFVIDWYWMKGCWIDCRKYLGIVSWKVGKNFVVVCVVGCVVVLVDWVVLVYWVNLVDELGGCCLGLVILGFLFYICMLVVNLVDCLLGLVFGVFLIGRVLLGIGKSYFGLGIGFLGFLVLWIVLVVFLGGFWKGKV